MLKLEELNREDEGETVTAEEISLEDVKEIPAPAAEEAVPEGFVDEAVEAVEAAAETAPEEKDASEDLPYA